MNFAVSAPGKTILYGEHAVVHGVPAIAASVALHTYISVSPISSNLVELSFPDVGLAVSWPNIERKFSVSEPEQTLNPEIYAHAKFLAAEVVPESQPFGRVACEAFAYLYLAICDHNTPPLRFQTTSTLPIGAGLGSSASFSACLAAALLKAANKLTDDTPHEKAMELVTKYSFLGECCIHGKPSGIDNVVATRGGAVYFQKQAEGPLVRPYLAFPELQLLLTDTTVPRLTSELVERVHLVKQRWPSVFKPLLETFAQIVAEADKLLSSPPEADFVEKISELAELNHGLLATLSVSHPSLEKVRDASKVLGIGTTKLTGAGGGGCAITIASGLGEGIDQFREMLGPQYKVFVTTLGVRGVAYVNAPRGELSSQKWNYW